MGRESRAIFSVVWAAVVVIPAVCAAPMLRAQAKPKPPSAGWNLPAEADTVKNPLTVNENVIAGGKTIFKDKCERCHGPKGLGDGPDADPDSADNMDLTDPKRTERNSDGVVFYKVMNGRRKPKMPVFKEELTTDQVWAIVAYVQTLRRPKP